MLDEDRKELMEKMTSDPTRYSWQQFAAALTLEELNEVSMSRLLGHIRDDEGFAIVTAYRDDRKDIPGENRRLNAQLAYAISNQFGKSHSAVRGSSVENPGTNREVSVPGEYSFVIFDVSREEAEAIRKFVCSPPFNQDYILWGSKKEGCYWLYKNGSEEYIGPAAKIGNVGKFWSMARHKKIEFGKNGLPLTDIPALGPGEGLVYAPCNGMADAAWTLHLCRFCREILRDEKERKKIAEEVVDAAIAADLDKAGVSESRMELLERLTAEPNRYGWEPFAEALGHQVVAEASMSRLLGHIRDDEGIAIASASRAFRTNAQNARLTRELGALLSNGYGKRFYRAKGAGYIEDPGTDHEKRVPSEESFVVIDISKEDAWELMRQIAGRPYLQQGIVWASKDEGVFELRADGTEKSYGPAVKIGDVGAFWTRLRSGKQFEFGDDGLALSDIPPSGANEGLRYAPDNYIDAMGWRKELCDLCREALAQEKRRAEIVEEVVDDLVETKKEVADGSHNEA